MLAHQLDPEEIKAKVRLGMNIRKLIYDHQERCDGCALPIIEIIEDAQHLGIGLTLSHQAVRSHTSTLNQIRQ